MFPSSLRDTSILRKARKRFFHRNWQKNCFWTFRKIDVSRRELGDVSFCRELVSLSLSVAETNFYYRALGAEKLGFWFSGDPEFREFVLMKSLLETVFSIQTTIWIFYNRYRCEKNSKLHLYDQFLEPLYIFSRVS